MVTHFAESSCLHCSLKSSTHVQLRPICNSNLTLGLNLTGMFTSKISGPNFAISLNTSIGILKTISRSNSRSGFSKKLSALKVKETCSHCGKSPLVALNNNHFITSKYSTSVTPTPIVSLSYIKGILQSRNINIEDGYTCLTIKCVFCKENSNLEKRLYINKVTGYFSCNGCKAQGSWDSLENALKNGGSHFTSENVSKASPEKWVSICEKSEPLKNLPEGKVQDILKQFKFKDNSKEILDQLETLVNQSGTHLYIPIKYGNRIVGIKELTVDGRETTIPNIGCKGLLIIKSCQQVRHKKRKEAIVVQSVRDLLALSSINTSYDIISLPHGVNNLPQEVLPLLEDYVKITLWFGNTENHWESARHLSKKLNDERCYFVRPTEERPSPEVAEREGRDLVAILESAAPIAHRAITHFSALRDDVFAHLQNNEKAGGVKWERFPVLNSIMKGHRRGEMTILTGPSGAGKTTFISEYSLDLAMQGVTTLWGSFEIKNERLVQTMLQQLCQFPLHLHLDRFNKWADVFQELPIYFMTFHGQQPLKIVMEAVEHAAYVYDVSHVIIDNIQFMMGHSDNDNSLDRFYKQDSIIGAFRNFATTANCHATLIIHPRKERDADLLSLNSVFGGAKATQEADNVLIIQQKTMQNLKIKKMLQIAKNRYSGDLGVMPLDFNKEALSFAKRVKEEQKVK